MRGTLFRQTLFAEFELRIHEAVERGEPLTGESLSKLYLELVRKYYGQEQGIVSIDDKYGAEWAFIPHFYRNFYVYQYATSMIAGMSLLDGIVGDAAKKSGTLPAIATGISRCCHRDPPSTRSICSRTRVST
jgi:oligoendopeptidase F